MAIKSTKSTAADDLARRVTTTVGLGLIGAEALSPAARDAFGNRFAATATALAGQLQAAVEASNTIRTSPHLTGSGRAAELQTLAGQAMRAAADLIRPDVQTIATQLAAAMERLGSEAAALNPSDHLGMRSGDKMSQLDLYVAIRTSQDVSAALQHLIGIQDHRAKLRGALERAYGADPRSDVDMITAIAVDAAPRPVRDGLLAAAGLSLDDLRAALHRRRNPAEYSAAETWRSLGRQTAYQARRAQAVLRERVGVPEADAGRDALEGALRPLATLMPELDVKPIRSDQHESRA